MSETGTTLQGLAPETRQVNLEELEHLAAHELPRFYRQAYRQLENAQDAEDAVQDAFMSAYKNLSHFRGTAALSTWLTTIVTNAARIQRRRGRPVVSLEEGIGSGEGRVTLLETREDDCPTPEEICARSELQNLLAKAICRLSPASRRAIQYYIDGKTATEVSQALGIPEGTIKSQLCRARTRLAQLLRRELGLTAPAPRVNRTRVCQ
jgi:RNA polymerase sigma-70 factor, ECF subfamily